LLLDSTIDTSLDGGELSAMPKVVIAPFSNVTRPVSGESVTPAGVVVLIGDGLVVGVELVVALVHARRRARDDVIRLRPSAASSLTPVTVTTCGAIQFTDVNVNEAGLTVPSVGLSLLSGMTTSALGAWVKASVNVASPPDSVVTSRSAA